MDRNSKPKYERCRDDCPTTTIAPATTTAASTTTIKSDDGKSFIIAEIQILYVGSSAVSQSREVSSKLVAS